jgi:hypothetical protein
MTDDELRSLAEQLRGGEDPIVAVTDGPALFWPPDNDQTD